MQRKKKLVLLGLGLMFTMLITMGPECAEHVDTHFNPIDPNFTTYVSIGDSITQGVMSGDANYFTQPNAYPYLLAQQANTEMGAPLMVAEPSDLLFSILNTDPDFAAIKTALDAGTVHSKIVSSFSTNNKITLSGSQYTEVITSGSSWIIHDNLRNWQVKDVGGTKLEFYGLYHRMVPGMASRNLGVSGMDVYLSSLTSKNKTVSNWQRTKTFSGNFSDLSFAFTDELDAVLSPTPIGATSTALEVAKSLKPTLITFWLGNNDALGCVASTKGAESLGSIIEGGITYTTPGFPYACKLDDADPRGAGFPPAQRISTFAAYGSSFQTAYQTALNKLLTDNPNAKIVVLNVPDVTGIAHLLTFAEAKQFFIRYAKVSKAEIDGVWGSTGFGGNAGSQVAFDGMLIALGIFKQQKAGGASNLQALGACSQGKAIGSGGNVGFFDWDVNNLTTAEATTLSNLIGTKTLQTDQFTAGSINRVIDDTLAGLGSGNNNRVIRVDAYWIFKQIAASGMDVKDASGNSVGLPVLTRSYPGSQDLATSNGSNGGIFSLDGVHPGLTAHARVANEIINRLADTPGTNPLTSGFGINIPRVDEYAIWLKDPFIDHDRDGYVVGFSFTLSSSLSAILRDPNDNDPNSVP